MFAHRPHCFAPLADLAHLGTCCVLNHSSDRGQRQTLKIGLNLLYITSGENQRERARQKCGLTRLRPEPAADGHTDGRVTPLPCH